MHHHVTVMRSAMHVDIAVLSVHPVTPDHDVLVFC